MARTMSKKHLLAGLAAAGVLSVGIAAPAVAFAEDGATPTPSASSSEGTDRQQQRADRQSEFAGALAKELGVPTEKVTDALEKLREQHKADRPERGEGRGDRPWHGGKDGDKGDRGERPDAAERQAALKEQLAKAVEDGKLTQEQADAITAAFEAGVFPGGPGRGHGPQGGETAGK